MPEMLIIDDLRVELTPDSVGRAKLPNGVHVHIFGNGLNAGSAVDVYNDSGQPIVIRCVGRDGEVKLGPAANTAGCTR